MSAPTEVTAEICAAPGCGKGARSNARLHPCSRCELKFHTSCGGFTSVLKDGGGTTKVCSRCVALANPESSRNSLAVLTPRSCTSSRSNSPANSTHSNASTERDKEPTTNETLNIILRKLDDNSKRLADIEAKLEPLQDIPRILARVEANEQDISEIKANQDALRQELDEIKSAGIPGPPAEDERVAHLVQLNENLEAKVKVLSAQRNEDTDSVVIGGIRSDEISSVNLKKFSYALLKAISPDLIPHDILSARLLQPRQTANSSEMGNGEGAELPATRQTNTASQIVVSMHSSSLVKQVISDKAKLGKLHSSRIDGSLAQESGCTTPLKNFLISVNEFLPPDTYKLRRLVFRKSKEEPKFKAFVRQGQLRVKWNKNDSPRVIYTEDDLNNFLSTR